MGSVISWFHNIRWLLVCVISIAVLLSAQSVSNQMSDGTATLWGSALGAAAAVAGAAWASDRQARIQRRNASALVHTVFEPVATEIHGVARRYGAPSNSQPDGDQEPDAIHPEGWKDIRSRIEELDKRWARLRENLKRMESALNLLGPSEMQIVLRLESELETLMGNEIAILRSDSSQPGVQLYPQFARWSLRFRLQAYDILILRYMDKLRTASK